MIAVMVNIYWSPIYRNIDRGIPAVDTSKDETRTVFETLLKSSHRKLSPTSGVAREQIGRRLYVEVKHQYTYPDPSVNLML